MLQNALLLCWLAVSASATECSGRTAAFETVTILSSKGGGKLSAQVKPVPTGPVEVRLTITDPRGNARSLPPATATPDGDGRITGPELPSESQGFLLKVEVIDPATGATIGTNWGIVG
jgi:hypothetical protein